MCFDAHRSARETPAFMPGRDSAAREACPFLSHPPFGWLSLHNWSRESGSDAFAKVNELTIGRVVFEGVDVPVAPDAVVDVGAVSATANGNLMVDACINTRNDFNPGVVAAKPLCLQFFPESVVFLRWYTVFTQRVVEEVFFAIP